MKAKRRPRKAASLIRERSRLPRRVSWLCTIQNQGCPNVGGRGVVGGEGKYAPTESKRRDVARDGANGGATAGSEGTTIGRCAVRV